MGQIGREVYVIGVGMPKWGELWDKTLRDIFVEAALMAIDDAGIDHIDSMVIGSMSPGLYNKQEHIASVMADYLGVKGIPATRVESACASGGLAVRTGFMEIASGMSDIVLAGGVEKMWDGEDFTMVLATAADQEYEAFHGITFPGLFAMVANRYLYEFPDAKREDLAFVSVKNHKNGAKNPRAQYRREITVENVLSSTMVADPLRLLDCSPVTDGAAAVLLATKEIAEKLHKHPLVQIVGVGAATDTIALDKRDSLVSFSAVKKSAEQAYKMAELSPQDIDTAEVHDCFSIAEIIVTEDLGFFEKGKGALAVRDGSTQIGGKIPVNTSGGLKSKGHPVGATGAAQIVEITEQLRGASGNRQIENAKIGLTQNMGGTAGSSVVHILKRR